VDLAAARPSKDRATRKIVRGQPEERLRRLRLAALANVRRAEHAYVRVRGNGRCVVPSAKGGA